jgi:hypothetical protein
MYVLFFKPPQVVLLANAQFLHLTMYTVTKISVWVGLEKEKQKNEKEKTIFFV